MRYHFSGVAGAGMNPLASLVRARGHDVQGSDRSFDQGKNQDIAARLRLLGIQLAPHDGTAVTRAIDRFVYSAAVEADTPEMRAAGAPRPPPPPPPPPPAPGGHPRRPRRAPPGPGRQSPHARLGGLLPRRGGRPPPPPGGGP